MLLLGIAIHLIFFFIGFISHASPGTLQSSGAISDYLSSGLVFVHVIISVLMIVGWLVFMFKNNAFKSFYPSSGKKLFFEFFQYFIIIFISSTFYFSYMVGFRLFINYKYDDEKMEKNIGIINRANAFLSQELELYTLDNRLFPKEFSEYYCETEINKIDKNQKYFVYHDRVYQYWSLYEKVVTERDKDGEFIYPEEEAKNGIGLAYFETSQNQKSRVYYFKKAVQDLSAYIPTTAPSYYNFSDVFYNINKSDNIARYRYEEGIPTVVDENVYKKHKTLINQKTTELLQSKNPKAIEELMQDFLAISKEFDIRNNLNAKDWAKLISHPDKFEVKQFIKKYLPKVGQDYDPNRASDGYYDGTEAAMDETAVSADNYLNENGEIVKDSVSIKELNPNLNQEVSPKDYFKKNMSGYYYYSANLRYLLENVYTVKTYDFFSQTVHYFLWFAFGLATFIFGFRVTNMRSLLFSIVSAGVIILLVTLFCVMSAFVFEIRNEFFIFYTMLTVGIVILLIPFLTLKRMSKLFSSIFMLITINSFPIFIWLILIIINEHQTANCRFNSQLVDLENDCVGFLDEFGFTLSYLVLIVSMLFLYFYTGFIKKWKALPE